MFVVNTEIEVNWVLPATGFPHTYTDFDVLTKAPDGTSVHYSTPIALEDYIIPTTLNTGAVSYKFTPDQKGVWVVVLTVGEPNNYDVYYEYFLRVSTPDVHIYQQVKV